MSRHHIYRLADGVRVEGTSRHIFIHNIDSYHLADLLIFADGVIDCWGPTDLAGLREKLESGWVATSFEDGGRVYAHHLGYWRFDGPEASVDARMLLGEVADEIDRLNGRPDSTGRCRRMVQRFLDEPTEANRAVLREHYLAIPEHLRNYALGDMDRRDEPLRVLATPVGERTPDPDDEPVTAEMHAEAVEYFEEFLFDEAADQPMPADGPETAEAATVTVPLTVYPRGWPDDPGTGALQLDYPAEIEAGGRRYPSAEHAYWALSTSDDKVRAAIAAEPNAFAARDLVAAAPRRQRWNEVRQAVMAGVLRAKFRQHPGLADMLLSTGDGRIECRYHGSAYWDGDGGNWLGRLIEVVRSELAAERAGIGIDWR